MHPPTGDFSCNTLTGINNVCSWSLRRSLIVSGMDSSVTEVIVPFVKELSITEGYLAHC